MTLALRPYQTRAIQDLRAAYGRGHRAPCLVLPTGAGKTVVAAAIIRAATERGKRVLFLAHRVELIDQSVAKLESSGVTDVRMIRAAHDLGNPQATTTVASIPTLVSKRWIDRLPAADFVIFDECHHVAAETWTKIADHYSIALLLGMTATPQRADGAALGDVFDTIVIGATVRELIELGHLARCRVQGPTRDLGTRAVAMTPAEAYSKYASGQRGVIFCSTVEESQRIAAEMPVLTAVVHGGMSLGDRADTLRRFRAGEIRCVANVFVLTEGWDDPGVAVCILHRNPQHAGTYLQMVGRVLRPAPGKAEALVIDLCGSTRNHGTPDMDRSYALDGKAIQTATVDIQQCADCGAVFERASTGICPYCDSKLVGSAKPIVKDVLGIGLEDLGKLPPRPMRAREIESKFFGKCAACSGFYQAGEKILWAKGQKATHVACPKPTQGALL